MWLCALGQSVAQILAELLFKHRLSRMNQRDPKKVVSEMDLTGMSATVVTLGDECICSNNLSKQT